MKPLVALLTALLLAAPAAAQDPAADQTAPDPRFALVLKERDAIAEAGRLRFTATADEPAEMRLKAVLRGSGGIVFSRFIDVSVRAAGQKRVVTVRLTRTAKQQLLELRRRIRLELEGRATDAAGNEAAVATRLKIAAR